MHPDYGKQVGTAFAAINQLHHDVSRLLTDVAAKLGTGRVNEKSVIRETSWLLNRPNLWMPRYVTLTSAGGDQSAGEVELLMVYLWEEGDRPQEPHLILGRVRYKLPADVKLWDLGPACFEWGAPIQPGVVKRVTPPDHDRIECVTFAAVPLFSIATVDDVLKLLETVRERAAVA
jgi:hypothetical protein